MQTRRLDFTEQTADMEERVRAMETRAHHWWRDSSGGLNTEWVNLFAATQAGWNGNTSFNYAGIQWRVQSDKVIFWGTVQYVPPGGSPALILPVDAWPLEDTTQTICKDDGINLVTADVTASNGHVVLTPMAALAVNELVRIDGLWWPYAVGR